MLARIDKTLEGVKETITQIQENDRNIENFKNRYNEIMQKMVENLAVSFGGNPLK
jgi:archaellum component FlaC